MYNIIMYISFCGEVFGCEEKRRESGTKKCTTKREDDDTDEGKKR